jgi:transposase-like protein
MSNDDVLFRFRLRVIALARELGSVQEACRMMEVHTSSFYRWRKLLERYGPEMLRPRERRRRRRCPMPSPTRQSSKSWPSPSLTPASGRTGSPWN